MQQQAVAASPAPVVMQPGAQPVAYNPNAGQITYPAPYAGPQPGFGGAYANPQMQMQYAQAAAAASAAAAGGKRPVVWMSVPSAPEGCPPGLEYLSVIDQLLVHQQIELLEMISGYETNNKYAIKNSMGQQVFFAAEDTDCCTRNCCGSARPFDIKILDNAGREVMHISRPYRCSSCWCLCPPCCLQEIIVSAPPGHVIGKVRQNYTCCKPFFSILDAEGESLLHVRGPCVPCRCCGNVDFKVLSRDETVEVGKIRKQWSGAIQELITDADNFGITFPMDMSVTAKATMLGAVFLIDFMFFEHTNNNNNAYGYGYY